MQILKYMAVVLFSALAGWFCQAWFAAMSNPAERQAVADTSVSAASPLSIDATPNITTATVGSSPAIPETSLIAEIGPTTFIENISVMDRDAFTQYLNSMGSDNSTIPKELLIGILNELPTITDKKTWYRIIDLLASSRTADMNTREFTAENWVMEKIRNVDQQTQWLEVVSHLGVWSRDNVEFLASNLESFQGSESRVSALLALSKSINLDPQLDANSDPGSVDNVAAENIQQYFDSDLELERAAAVSTLIRFPGDDYSGRLVNALDDPSERVRLSAIFGLMGGRRPNEPALKERLIERMQSSDATDFERLNAWYALGSFQLEGKQYDAVYEFSANEKERLTQRFKDGPSRPRSQWGY